MRKVGLISLLWVLSLFSGCGGYYIMTVPDQLVREGGSVVPVGRLQRNDFFFLAFGSHNTAMRFQLVDAGKLVGREEVAFTDKQGYAAVSLPVANVLKNPGVYATCVTIQDSSQGEEVRRIVPLFVWDPRKSVVVVDIDVLPRGELSESDVAGMVLRKIAKTNKIIYLTRKSKSTQKTEHDHLQRVSGSKGFCQGGNVVCGDRKQFC